MGSLKKLTGAVLFCKKVELFQTSCRLRSPWLVTGLWHCPRGVVYLFRNTGRQGLFCPVSSHPEVHSHRGWSPCTDVRAREQGRMICEEEQLVQDEVHLDGCRGGTWCRLRRCRGKGEGDLPWLAPEEVFSSCFTHSLFPVCGLRKQWCALAWHCCVLACSTPCNSSFTEGGTGPPESIRRENRSENYQILYCQKYTRTLIAAWYTLSFILSYS